MRILQALKKRGADIVAGAKRRALTVQTPAERLLAEQLAPSLTKLDTATNQLALQVAARQAALIDSPVQRLARQWAADQLKLIDSPLQRAARQAAASMPRLDLAASLHQPSGRDEAVDTSDAAGSLRSRARGPARRRGPCRRVTIEP